jgi:pseudouridine kinase
LHIQLNADFTPNKGSTIPCRLRQNLGGVAYNVTHALHLLKNHSVRLLTVSGSLTSLIKNDSTPALIHEIEGESTASYISLLDSKTNELICGFGDMGIYERQITPSFLDKNLSTLIHNQWIMFDANLSPLTMKHLIEIGNKYNKYLVFISAGGPNKARRITSYLHNIHVLFCNRLEFEAITQSSSSIESTLANLLKKYSNIKLICITMGADGVLIGINGKIQKYNALTIDKNQQEIQNVTGAGDSFAAGVMSQLLRSKFDHIDRAIACGLLAAKLTLTSANTISEELKIIDEIMIDEICLKQLKCEYLHM